MTMKIWSCKIGEVDARYLPNGADGPMRDAMAKVYRKLTFRDPQFIFSGWGAELTEGERAVVDNRTPETEAVEKTTDHVSVLRELSALIEPLESVKIAEGETDFVVMIGAKQAIKIREALRNCVGILSRATPSDDVRIGGVDSGEHVECVCPKCVNRYGDETDGTHYKPSAPRVVTDEDVERAIEAHRAEYKRTAGVTAEFPKLTMRAALESFATSLPAAIPPGFVLVPVEPTEAMTVDGSRTYESMWNELRPGEERIAMREAYKAMIAAAPKTEGKV